MSLIVGNGGSLLFAMVAKYRPSGGPKIFLSSLTHSIQFVYDNSIIIVLGLPTGYKSLQITFPPSLATVFWVWLVEHPAHFSKQNLNMRIAWNVRESSQGLGPRLFSQLLISTWTQ